MSDERTVVIRLTEDEADQLTLLLGYALGKASKEHLDLGFQRMALVVANAVHRDNPHWTPYQVPAE